MFWGIYSDFQHQCLSQGDQPKIILYQNYLIRRYINFIAKKKKGSFRQDLGGLTYLKCHPKKIFEGFFYIFLGINTQNFVNNDPNLKVSAYLMQNFMKLDLIKFSDPKAQTKLVQNNLGRKLLAKDVSRT